MLDALKPKKSTIILYLFIPVAMFVFTVFVPLVTAFYFSFFEWKSGQTIYTAFYTGFDNYKTLISDSIFWKTRMRAFPPARAPQRMKPGWNGM